MRVKFLLVRTFFLGCDWPALFSLLPLRMFPERRRVVDQWSPNFLAPGTGFTEDNFSTDGSGGAGAALAGPAAPRGGDPAGRVPQPLAQLHPAGHVPHLLCATGLDFPLFRSELESPHHCTPLYWHSCSVPITGYLKSRYLSQYAVHADDWLPDP